MDSSALATRTTNSRPAPAHPKMTHAYLLGSAGFVADAGLPLTDRGFRYGMSVFETVAIRASAPLLLEEHLALLSETASAAGFRPPPSWLDEIRSLLSRSPVSEGAVRVYVTAGDREGAVSRIAVLFEAMSLSTDLTAARAVTAQFTPALPFGKTGNYWPHFLVRPAGGDEAILYTPQGLLLGGAMANLFLIIDGIPVTPQRPVRRGVIRDWVGAREADLTRDDLSGAQAAFLTNSRIGIRNLVSIDGRELAGDPLVATIWERYRREVLRAG